MIEILNNRVYFDIPSYDQYQNLLNSKDNLLTDIQLLSPGKLQIIENVINS